MTVKMDTDFLYEIEIDDGNGMNLFPCRDKHGKFSVNLDGRSKGKGRYISASFEELLQYFADGNFQEKGSIRMKAPGEKGNGNGRSPINPRTPAKAFISDNFKRLVSERANRKVLSSVLRAESEKSVSGLDITKNFSSAVLDDKAGHPAMTIDAQGSLESDTRNLKTDEREAVVKIRFGQGNFRDALFNEKGHGAKCWMSGIEGRQLLIASHIKPWSHCKDESESRGRRDNGLLLSALWDAAFDAGLVSFESNWKVIASSKLAESARTAMNLKEHSELPEKFRTEGRKSYLAYHLVNVFQD